MEASTTPGFGSGAPHNPPPVAANRWTPSPPWGFLRPWLVALMGRITYHPLESESEAWASPNPLLLVKISLVTGFSSYEEVRPTFQLQLEGVKLLAAVAYVAPTQWKHLLLECRSNLRERGEEMFEQEIPAKFVVCVDPKIPDKNDQDRIVKLFGAFQHEEYGEEYLEAMAKIAAMCDNLKLNKYGVDIQVPIQLLFGDWCETFVWASSTENIEIPCRIEKRIREQWKSVEWSSKKCLATGSLQCTFVMGAMRAKFNEHCSSITPSVTKVLGDAILDGVRFDQLCIRTVMDRSEEVGAAWMAFGQLVGRVFDSARRTRELVRKSYRYDTELVKTESNEFQLDTVHLTCENTMQKTEVEALFSATAVAQTTKKLSVSLETNVCHQLDRVHWWKWVAYALFSTRAQKYSSVESLALLYIRSMSIDDMDGFESVLASEHPEEYLFGCSHGVVDERDATLKADSEIRPEIHSRNSFEPGTRSLVFPATVPNVRTFSDDGQSEWVNVLVPGFGRCTVQRPQLEFGPNSDCTIKSRGITSLTIGFDGLNPRISDGLPRFLKAIGYSLKCLTLTSSFDTFDENLILQYCPNLEELVLHKSEVDVRLNFTECCVNKTSFPELNRDWDDIRTLANDLSDTNNPLVGCVRRVRFRPAIREPEGPTDELKAILTMLDYNRCLEYVDIVVPSKYHSEMEFRERHLQPINRSLMLPTACKVAFLSVLSWSRSMMENTTKRTRCASYSARFELDKLVLANIFAFLQTPNLRKVYLREKCWRSPIGVDPLV